MTALSFRECKGDSACHTLATLDSRTGDTRQRGSKDKYIVNQIYMKETDLDRGDPKIMNLGNPLLGCCLYTVVHTKENA